MAYKLKNISKEIVNYTKFGTVINEMEVVEDVLERFEKAAANGLTEEQIIKALSEDKNLLFDEILVKEKTKPVEKKEEVKKPNFTTMKSEKIAEYLTEKGIKLTGDEKHKELQKLAKEL